jgi:tRNA(Arg) A34 adenosine deaminase TadA
MCLAACIWANIKKVYYGNTKEDAEDIGFRDDNIYEYLDRLCDGYNIDEILELINIDRDETIKSFEDFKKKEDKTIY